jgi:hypothetical protein
MATQTPAPADTNQISGLVTYSAPRRLVLDVLHDWVTTVDHKKIGLMYIGYALVFLVIGGFEALLMRIQLAIPNNTFRLAADLQQPLHHAWHHHDLLRWPCPSSLASPTTLSRS